MTTDLFAALRREAPAELFSLSSTLAGAGYDAFAVGGSIRDLVLGRPVTDWDVATRAKPDEVAALFERTTHVNARHGTTQVRLGACTFEVTTFRREGPYADRRRPDYVRFAESITEDLERRDFTMNAIAVDLVSGAVVDPFAGVADARSHLLRTVGPAEARFSEDALRILRAARFVATLPCEPSPEVRAAMAALAPAVFSLSAERVRDELVKLQGAAAPSVGFALLADTGVLDVVLPELAACRGVTQNVFHRYDVFEHSLRACDAAPEQNPIVRWAALLHDVGKVPTRAEREGRVTFYGHERVGAVLVADRLARLRFGRREAQAIVHLVANHMFHYQRSWTDAAVRRFVARVGLETLDDLFALRAADNAARGVDVPEPEDLGDLSERIARERARATAFTVRDLAVDGGDLMREMGIAPGSDVGALLRGLLEFVLSGRGENTREALLAEARRLHPQEAPDR